MLAVLFLILIGAAVAVVVLVALGKQEATILAAAAVEQERLALAIKAAGLGGTAPAILSAANEEAVALFLQGQIGFNDIYECVLSALESIEIIMHPDLKAITEADQNARMHVKHTKKA